MGGGWGGEDGEGRMNGRQCNIVEKEEERVVKYLIQ